MKTSKVFYLKGLMLEFSIVLSVATFAQTNLALTAEVTTSYVSSWENLEAVNDGFNPANSSDKASHGAYGNWRGAANYDALDWVEYSFSGNNKVDSVRVYWWTDGGGIQIPYDAYVEYWDCGSYVKVGNIGILKDQFNALAVNVETYKIRISMRSTAATGILELQAFGSAGVWTGLVPYIQKNSLPQEQINKITVNIGDTLFLSNDLTGIEGGTWSWTGPKGFGSTDSLLTIKNIQLIQTGLYTAKLESDCGIIFEQSFSILLNITDDQAYKWPAYTPALDYNFRSEYPALEMPTKNSQDCDASLIAGQVSSEWFTFVWGKNKRSVITEAAINPMLQRYNEDFAYIRDTMGWPPDKRVKDGYRSAIYLFGSGLCTDDVDSNELGGWMSSVNGYPMVLASYYPVYCFDPSCPYTDKEYQTGGMIHEEIHAVLADMPGAKEAAWFQEGGNTWLQQEMSYRRSGISSSMGNLNGCTFIAPFMPIECYSGWLQDNSFGGPSAQGVNMFSGSTQICTWRNFLGGNQYGNSFPTFLGQVLGKGSIPWIWRYCPGTVLEGMADSLGDEQIRRLIVEYRAKQTLVDMGEWTDAIRKLLNSNFKTSIKSEWNPTWITPDTWIASPYARTTLDSATGMLIPEYRTTPGWSGANQIPLYVKGDSVSVNFKPIGKNMKCQIAYRDVNGNPVYSQPVDSGNCSMLLQRPPANDVVFAVITNTDYKYEGDETRKSHFDYRIQIDTMLTMPAHTHKRWYAWDENPADEISPVLPAISSPDTSAPLDLSLALEDVYENDKTNTQIGIFSTVDPNDVTAQVYSLVSGIGDDDNSSYKISGNKLLIKRTLDYETKPICTIRVRTTNLTSKYVEKSFEIAVIDVDETTGIESLTADNNVLIFPNPFNQSTKVKLLNNESIKKIEIINLTGTIVKSIEGVNSNEYILLRDNLSEGIYYLRINASQTYYVNVIVQ